jgi:lysozyme
MKLDESGYKALHQREGLRLKPYLDTRGIATIAMGNITYLDGRKVTLKDGALTLEEANELGKLTADKFALEVDKLVKSNVNQNQFNALVSLAYNIGLNGFKNSTVLRLVNANPDNGKIQDGFMMWTKNPELVGRRKSEVKQYFQL